MYESFFGLQSRPFSAAPNPELYFAAGAIEHARQTLTRSIERAEGVSVLVGPAGTGKSLLMQVLARQFADSYRVAMLASARLCTRRALLQNILFELKLPYRDMEEGELRLSLIDHLEPETSPGMLLLVDEAHTLPMRLLEEIRMITNLVRDGEPRVRLVLAGTRSLEERLAHPKLDSLNQRIAARCYLEALSTDETRQMVRHQLEAAGGHAHDVFQEEALTAIHQATDGVPRLINQVAEHSLILAGVGGVKPVHADGISEAWADLQQLPLPWNAANPKRDDTSSMIEFGSLEEDSLLNDSLFADTPLETEQFTPTGAEENEQVELRLAAVPQDHDVEAGAVEDDAVENEAVDEAAQTVDEHIELTDGLVAQTLAAMAGEMAEEMIREESETEHHTPIEVADLVAEHAADEQRPDLEQDLEDDAEPATLSIERPVDTLVGEAPSTVALMDDPFNEAFDQEEVVIEGRGFDTAPLVKVDGGILSKEVAELMAAPAHYEQQEMQSWTIDVETVVVEPIVEVAQAGGIDEATTDELVTPLTSDATADIEEDAAAASAEDSVPRPKLIALDRGVDIPAIDLHGETADVPSSAAATAPVPSEPAAPQSEVALSDSEQWEPTFGALTEEEIVDSANAEEPAAEPRLAVESNEDEEPSTFALDDGDLIIIDDQPSTPAASGPKARAVVRDYRRLFAQLRRG